MLYTALLGSRQEFAEMKVIGENRQQERLDIIIYTDKDVNINCVNPDGNEADRCRLI